MNIGFVASEAWPLSKTGGLGDVSGALPQALAARGHSVTLFTPAYRGIALDGAALSDRFDLWIGDTLQPVGVCTSSLGDVTVALIESPWAFDRAGLYQDQHGSAYADNVGRFSLFCRAALQWAERSGWRPDVWHCHDWQSALLPVYLAQQAAQRAAAAPVVFTIHNLGYQGLAPAVELYSAGLGWDWFTPELLEYHGQLSLLKGGIVCSQAVTTVSPTYAREIQTADQGMGLDGLLRHSRGKLTGILNGIDTQVWDPATDPHLPARYSVTDGPERWRKAKARCKAELQAELGLAPNPDAFLLGMITRFDAQKGVPLALAAAAALAGKSVQLALLGSGDSALEELALDTAALYPGSIGVALGYSEPLAHRIYAGADALLMPSRYEPCGLNQMYAQRYGTVPIVRATGGLADTVRNWTPRRAAKGRATGFSFKPFTSAALKRAIRRARRLYRGDPDGWLRLQDGIMRLDRSWAASAAEYEALYARVVKETRRGAASGTGR